MNETKYKADTWDGIWFGISLVLAQASSFLTVYPILTNEGLIYKTALTSAFGMFLTACFFLVGVPCIDALRALIKLLMRKVRVGKRRTSSTENS